MWPAKRLGGFFVRCMLYYGLLILPWTGLTAGYGALYRAGGNLLFCRFGSGGAVQFEPLSSQDHAFDTRLVLNKIRPPTVRAELDVKAAYTGYRPTAFLVALVLATPIPWSRRLRALVWGLLWVTTFVALRTGLRLFDTFTTPGPLALYNLSAFWKGVVTGMYRVLVLTPAGHYLVPAVIWGAVTCRRGGWATLLTTKPSGAAAHRPA